MADIKVGVSIPTIIGNPIDMATVAKRAEELGFESIWAPEHTLVPVNVETRFPYSEDGAVPPYYSHMMDPFVALSHASASTSTIKLGTGVTLLPERNPILLAKVIASLDHFSGGRTVVGIGAGWLREELEIMGGNFRRRWSQARESVLAMKKLWTKEVSEFHGEFYDFPPLRSFPKPAQKPHPPILLGGMAKRVLNRVVEYGDGWAPNIASYHDITAAAHKLTMLCAEAGRDPRGIGITVYQIPPERDVMRRLGEAGAYRAVTRIDGDSTQSALDYLDKLALEVL